MEFKELGWERWIDLDEAMEGWRALVKAVMDLRVA
jgi:hypothetical protein